jgi:hypothetical protein
MKKLKIEMSEIIEANLFEFSQKKKKRKNVSF